KADPDKLRLVGTDGFRLSYCDLQLDLPEDFLKQGICLSKRTLLELKRMCQEGYENIRLSISADQTTLLASVQNYKLFSRLSAVKYPNYKGVLPTANLNPVKLSRQTLQSMTRRVLLAADKTHALRLHFDDHSLTLSSKNLGSSEGKESLDLRD